MSGELTLEVDVAASPTDVWAAVVDGERRKGWWSYLDLDARPGGVLTERWRDAEGSERVTAGKVLVLDPPRRLRCTWQDEDWPSETQVELTLQQLGAGTRVRLRHIGWDRLGAHGDQLRSAHEQGWRNHLQNLKSYVERPTRG